MFVSNDRFVVDVDQLVGDVGCSCLYLHSSADNICEAHQILTGRLGCVTHALSSSDAYSNHMVVHGVVQALLKLCKTFAG